MSSLHALSYYKKRFDTNFQIFANTLDEIVKVYPLYKEYPNYAPYLNDYQNSVEQLKEAQNQILYTKRELQQDNYMLNVNVSKINKKYTELEKENEKFTKELDMLINSDSAAHGALDDKSQQYRINFAENLVLHILIYIGIILFFRNITNPGSIKFSKLWM